MKHLRSEINIYKSISFSDILDNYVRLLGSYWESRFSFLSLILMKLNDLFNEVIYRGNYGIKVDMSKFVASRVSTRLTIRQLDAIPHHNKKIEYLKFKNAYKNRIKIYELNQDAEDTLPAYYSGVVDNINLFYTLMSFRSWRNFNEPGKFPKADFLFSHFRIFSKRIMLFR